MAETKKKSPVWTAVTLLLLLVSVLILMSVMTARQRGEMPKILGYSLHVVVTDSMDPLIKPGDFVLARDIKIDKVTEGDSVVFKSVDPDIRDKIIVHSVIGVNGSGSAIKLTTQGVKTGAQVDPYPVTEANYIGVVKLVSPLLGKVMNFLSDIGNMLFFTFIVLAMIGVIKFVLRIWKKSPDEAQEVVIDKAVLEAELRAELMNELTQKSGDDDKDSGESRADGKDNAESKNNNEKTNTD